MLAYPSFGHRSASRFVRFPDRRSLVYFSLASFIALCHFSSSRMPYAPRALTPAIEKRLNRLSGRPLTFFNNAPLSQLCVSGIVCRPANFARALMLWKYVFWELAVHVGQLFFNLACMLYLVGFTSM